MNLQELKKNQEPKIKTIWNHYTNNGKNENPQRLLLLEELSELQAKLFKVLNGRIKLKDPAVIEEFADVLIMLAQFSVDIWGYKHAFNENKTPDYYLLDCSQEILKLMTYISNKKYPDPGFPMRYVYHQLHFIIEYLNYSKVSTIYETISIKLDRQIKRIKNEKTSKYCSNCRGEEDGVCSMGLKLNLRAPKVFKVDAFDKCDEWEAK